MVTRNGFAFSTTITFFAMPPVLFLGPYDCQLICMRIVFTRKVRHLDRVSKIGNRERTLTPDNLKKNRNFA